jgi:hypothetical protein
MIAGEKFGIKGRRTIRRPTPGREARHVGLWDLQTQPGTRLAALERAYLSALDTVDRVEGRRAESAKSGIFTADGLRGDVLQFAAQLSPTLARGRQQIAAAKREVAELKSKIKIAPIDKTDMVSAVLRVEMRDFLRSKPQAERDAYLRANAEKLDPQMALAIMEVPAEMSGVSSVQREALIERALEVQHGDTIREVKELERGIEIAERAVELGREEIIREAEADPLEFDQVAAPFEAKATAPWLRRRAGTNEVRVVDLERGVERLPTADELDSGIEAATLEEFNARKAA